MKNIYIRLALFFSVFLLASGTSYGSHISGGDFSITCLGNGEYVINLNLYRDCSGIPVGTSETITIASASGSCPPITVNAPLINPGGTEVSQLCPSVIDSSTCAGGNLPGMEHYIFQTIVTLPPCDDWIVSWNQCCRNTAVNALNSTGLDMTLMATIDNNGTGCNSTPVFTAQPIPYVCINQLVTYNYGVYEPDGDSISFSFVDALDTDPNTPITYNNPPYSATNPIDGVTLDPQTGQLTFTPTTLGNFIVAVQVSEYDDQGNVISTVTRDIQFVVENCTNQVPYDTMGTIMNLTGDGFQVGPSTVQMCDGGSFSFDIEIGDPDSLDIVSLTSNVEDAIPGSTFTMNPGNPATGTISWTAQGGNSFFNTFTVFAEDDACPVTGLQSYVYTVQVLESTVASEDVIVTCGTQVGNMFVNGGSQFVWSVLSGDSIILDSNFWCLDADTICSQVIADPDTTTTYLVTSDLINTTCEYTDTVTVFVVPDYSFTYTQDDTAICLYETVNFNITPTPGGVYTYLWEADSLYDISDSSVANPQITYNAAGTILVPFQITSPDGCTKFDTTTVQVSASPIPAITVVGDTTICVGDSVQLSLDNANYIPPDCDAYQATTIPFAPLSGSGTTVSLGDDQFTGALPIGFDFQFYCGTYDEFYISSNGWLTFTAPTTSALGDQLIPNATNPNNLVAFAWDDLNPGSGGTIEYFTTGTSPNQILVVNFTNVPHFGSTANTVTTQVLLYESDAAVEIHSTNIQSDGGTMTQGIEDAAGANAVAPAGRNQAVWTAANDAVRFELPPPPSVLLYTWSPSQWLSDTTIENPIAAPLTDTTYTVIVTDSIGGCSDTASINLYLVPQFTWNLTQEDTVVCLLESTAFLMDPDTTGGVTYTYEWTPDTYIDYDTVANPNAQMDESGTHWFYVAVTSDLGCTNYDSLSIDVSTGVQPSFIIVGDTTVCSGGSTELSVEYLAAQGASCDYTLKMFDSFGDGWNGASIDILINGVSSGVNYTVPNVPGDSNIVTVTLNHGDSISLDYSSGTFENEVTYELYDSEGLLVFSDGPSPTTGIAFTFVADCIPGDQGTYAFAWTPASTLDTTTTPSVIATPILDTTTYQLIIIDTVGFCTDTADIDVYVVPNFGWSTTQSDTAVCLNETVALTVTPDTAGNFLIDWTTGNQLSQDSIMNPIVTMTQSGQQGIVFELISDLGCENYDTIWVDVSNGAVPVVTVLGDTTICLGDSAQLFAQNSGVGAIFEDDFNGGANGNWTLVSTSVGTACASSSGDALIFDGATPRSATTPSVNVPAGGTVSFWLVNGTGGGCELPDFGENLELQYSINGGASWITINTYTAGNFPVLTFISEAIPPGAQTTNTMFQLLQTNSSGVNFDMWAIDDFVVTGTGSDYTYEWFPATNLSDPFIVDPYFSGTVDATYQVVVTDTVGNCADTASIDLYVVPNFTWTLNQSDTGVCLNDTVNFQIVTNPAGNYTYLWTDSLNFLAGDTTDENTTGTFTYAGTQQLVYSMTTDLGCTNTDTATVQVSTGLTPVPIIIGDSTLCDGDSTQFMVDFVVPALTCEHTFVLNDAGGNGWQGALLNVYQNGFLINGMTVAAGSSATFTFTFNQGDEIELEYVPSFFGNEADNSYQFIGPYGDILFSDGPTPSAGVVFTYDAACATTENYVYDWTPGTSLSDSTINNPWASPNADISYTVFVMDSIGGCSGSKTINMTVVPDFDPTLTQSDTVACLLESVAFTVLDNTPGTSTYQWYNSVNNPNLMFPDDQPAMQAAFTESGTITFYVDVTNDGGCTRTDSATVVVSPGPQPNINITTDTNNFCVGNSAQLNVENTEPVLGCEYTIEMYDSFGDGWTGGAQLQLVVNGTTTYDLTLPSGSFQDTSITLFHGDDVVVNYTTGNLPGEESYAIFDPDGNIVFTAGPPTTSGTNIFNFTSDCGIDISNYQYTWIGGQSSLNQVNIQDPIASPLFPTQYIVVVTDLVGQCSDVDTLLIDVDLPPDASIDPAGPLCNSGTAVNLTALTAGGTWTGVGITDSTGVFDPATAGAGSHQVTYTVGVVGCTSDSTMTILVNTTPNAPIAQSNPFYCEGDSLINFSAVGPPAATFEWYDSNNGLVSSSAQPAAADVGVAIIDDYFLVAQTVNSCVSPFDTLYPNVIEMPIASFVASEVSGVAPLPVDFTNTSTPAGSLNYLWDFDDLSTGATSTDQDPMYTFTEFGQYFVTLIASNSSYPACADTAMQDIVVSGEAVIEMIPNVFTPDGDGQNDEFRIVHTNLIELHVSIYNRWGRKVAELNSPDDTWDGGSRKDGTYFWVIDVARGLDGQTLPDFLEEDKRQGSVTMIGSGN